MKRFNLVDFLAEIKIKVGVGQGWFYEFRNAVLIGASLKVLLSLTIGASIILTLGLMVLFYIIGVIDVAFIKLYQKINELTASKYNPHLNQISQLKRKV